MATIFWWVLECDVILGPLFSYSVLANDACHGKSISVFGLWDVFQMRISSSEYSTTIFILANCCDDVWTVMHCIVSSLILLS